MALRARRDRIRGHLRPRLPDRLRDRAQGQQLSRHRFPRDHRQSSEAGVLSGKHGDAGATHRGCHALARQLHDRHHQLDLRGPPAQHRAGLPGRDGAHAGSGAGVVQLRADRAGGNLAAAGQPLRAGRLPAAVVRQLQRWPAAYGHGTHRQQRCRGGSATHAVLGHDSRRWRDTSVFGEGHFDWWSTRRYLFTDSRGSCYSAGSPPPTRNCRRARVATNAPTGSTGCGGTPIRTVRRKPCSGRPIHSGCRAITKRARPGSAIQASPTAAPPSANTWAG